MTISVSEEFSQLTISRLVRSSYGKSLAFAHSCVEGESGSRNATHVPAAFLAINIYLMMTITSLVWLIRRHYVSALAAKSSAMIGLTMTIVTIITGSLWGSSTWGTYWVWDPRLTSFAILLCFYVGYILLWQAIKSLEKAANVTSLFCIIGSVFALLSRYIVFFIDQGLHQGPTLSLDQEKNIDNSYYFPLILAVVGFLAVPSSRRNL